MQGPCPLTARTPAGFRICLREYCNRSPRYARCRRGSSGRDDQAQADTARAAAVLEVSGQQTITPQMLQRFARTARERIRIDGGGYRRDHLRALAQRVEVADREVHIIGSKSNLLQTLTAAAGVKPTTPGVRSSVLKWRREWDSNPRYAFTYTRFPSVRLKPLGHLSRSRPLNSSPPCPGKPRRLPAHAPPPQPAPAHAPPPSIQPRDPAHAARRIPSEASRNTAPSCRSSHRLRSSPPP